MAKNKASAWAVYDPRKTELPIPEAIGATRQGAIDNFVMQDGRLYQWNTYLALGFTVEKISIQRGV